MVEIASPSHFDSIENLVIVGSGPAGYTAAIYTARANLNPLLLTGFEQGGIPGGQLMTTTHVENYPGFPNGVLGPDLMDLMKAQAVRWGTRLLDVDANNIDFSQLPYRIITSEDQIVYANAIILATGASANRLRLPNEELFWSKGISACAICDGATPQFRNNNLAVVGGGDSACEEAVYLTKYSSEVHLIVRSNHLRASAAMVDRVRLSPLIKIHWNTEVVDVFGDKWLDKLQLRNRENNSLEELEVKGLFYAIGHTPNTSFLNGQLMLDKKGYLFTQRGRPETSLEGVFAAGDVADAEWRQGITAAGSGCSAALAAERWLTYHGLSIKQQSNVETSLANSNKLTSEEEYVPLNNWHKGSIALRRIYHESKEPLLVVYTSPSCGPCHVLKPQLKRVLNELEGKVQGVEIDIELEADIALQAGVNGTPTVQLFHNKELKQEWRGVKKRSEFKSAIEALI
uniref:Thioredoxin reductase n=1 Tax=Paulinella chromatophora TaxID=39717 RepID=B1X3G8_PAUCH|nr:Thioredoxin reductase [Paulinella chromatophora]ACB42487.1 Thioredoxin reductase [Paulinella chromatophora]|eukprot:gb/GEZN01003986.1/.p1 GENE.gb/GEZN01003986.1/~~gb/GEZN01003986.1/.p1  ORF type:complete len:458 (-),score=11.23 gb/GEZN01003986.1/:472-1845(-)